MVHQSWVTCYFSRNQPLLPRWETILALTGRRRACPPDTLCCPGLCVPAQRSPAAGSPGRGRTAAASGLRTRPPSWERPLQPESLLKTGSEDQKESGTRRATVVVPHEGDPHRVMIVALGVGSDHSPPTALEHGAVTADEETGTFPIKVAAKTEKVTRQRNNNLMDLIVLVSFTHWKIKKKTCFFSLCLAAF